MPATVTYTWEPAPVEMAQAVLLVDDALRDVELPLMLAGQELQADVRQRFITETDPSGSPWQPWAESYLDRAGENAGILRKTEDLYEAAIADEAVIVNGDTLFYDTSGLPEYGAYHQEGKPHRKTKGGSPNPLPKREFLGLSDVASIAIFATFADWFDRSIDLFETATGRLGRRHAMRGGLGRFIPRSAPMPIRTRL